MIKESNVVTVCPEEERMRNIRYTAVSSMGARESQQDSLFVGEKGQSILAVICDGMGGMNGGERASCLAVQRLVEAFYEQELSDVPRFYRRMAFMLDEAVYAIKDGEQLMGAGTTIVSVVADATGLYWLSVGDSKLWLYRRGELLCPVAAHNYRLVLQEMLTKGKITPEVYRQEAPKAEALISYLGMGGISRMEINRYPFRLEAGDSVLLSSDGLYKSVPDEEILETLSLRISTEVKAQRLLNRALELGGQRQDNTSIILLEA